MKLKDEDVVRSFLRSICEECWYSENCEYCVFWRCEKCMLMASPCCWNINDIIAAREKAVKKNEL